MKQHSWRKGEGGAKRDGRKGAKEGGREMRRKGRGRGRERKYFDMIKLCLWANLNRIDRSGRLWETPFHFLPI